MSKAIPKNLTDGPILKTLVTLAIPIMLSSILQTAYNLTDTFWVGRLGAGAVAAVSLSFPVLFLIISLGSGLAVAGTILAAQYKGRQDTPSVNHVASQTLAMMFLISIAIGVLGYFISPLLMRLMGAPAEVAPDATMYLRIAFIGVLFMFTYYVFESLLRGIGNSKTPVYIVLTTVLLNLFLDPLFIFGWGPLPALGVSGAALATLSTQAIASIIGLFLLFSGRYGITIERKNFRLDLPLIKKMFFLGLPSSIEQSARAMSFVFLTFFAAQFGTIAIAAYGIRNRISSFLIFPALGLSVATSAMIGQNLGADKKKRAQKTANISRLIIFATLSVIGLIFFVFARQIISAFIPADEQVIASGTRFLRITAPFMGLLGLEIVSAGILRGAGATTTAMATTLCAMWLFQIPVSYILSLRTHLGLIGLYWSFSAANIFGAVLALIVLKFSKWKQKNLAAKFGSLTSQVTEEVISDEGLSA